MKTLEQAFAERSRLLSLVETEAEEVLTDFCKRRGFLLVGRTKTLESLRDKLETGRYASFDDMDDIIAFSVVIDTLSQEREVRSFLRKAFNVIVLKASTTLQDERAFDFDSTRVYCRLFDRIETGSGKDNITFEVQIRTLLQHAWSKITHPHVYKAQSYDPRSGRLAAELMAHLEVADRSLSRFKSVARTVKIVRRRDSDAASEITAMIDQLVDARVIPSEQRPTNGRRLGENIYRAIRYDQRKEYRNVILVLREFLETLRDAFPRSLTLFQLCLVALHDAKLLERGTKSKPRLYYVTDDLLTLFPQVADITSRVAIS